MDPEKFKKEIPIAKKRKKLAQVANLKVSTVTEAEQLTRDVVAAPVSPFRLCAVLSSRPEPEDLSPEAQQAALIGGILVHEMVQELSEAMLIEELVIYTDSRNTQRLVGRKMSDPITRGLRRPLMYTARKWL